MEYTVEVVDSWDDPIASEARELADGLLEGWEGEEWERDVAEDVLVERLLIMRSDYANTNWVDLS